jgi:hypothetical protein
MTNIELEAWRNALLLSANLSDFKRIPALRVEDWLLPPRSTNRG